MTRKPGAWVGGSGRVGVVRVCVGDGIAASPVSSAGAAVGICASDRWPLERAYAGLVVDDDAPRHDDAPGLDVRLHLQSAALRFDLEAAARRSRTCWRLHRVSPCWGFSAWNLFLPCASPMPLSLSALKK